jgi:hypothetical protein
VKKQELLWYGASHSSSCSAGNYDGIFFHWCRLTQANMYKLKAMKQFSLLP